MQRQRAAKDQEETPARAAVAFLPWLGLRESIQVGGFRFSRLDCARSKELFGARWRDLMARILDSYIDLRGNPITSCTVITNPRRGWNVDPRDFNKILMASEMLGLSVLSAQRFFEPLAPYVNAAAFRPVIQGVDLNSDQISLLMRRRGLSLQTGGPGLTYRSVRFHCPESLYLVVGKFRRAITDSWGRADTRSCCLRTTARTISE